MVLDLVRYPETVKFFDAADEHVSSYLKNRNLDGDQLALFSSHGLRLYADICVLSILFGKLRLQN